MTGPRTFALLGLTLTLVGVVGTAIVRWVSPAPFIPVAFGFVGATMAGYAIQGLTWTAIGSLLVVRRPENVIGWLMIPVGVGYALSQLTVAATFSFVAIGSPDSDRLAQIAGWTTVLLQLVTILHFAIGFLFPTGRPQSPHWAIFMRVFWVFSLTFVALSLIQPGPLQLIPALENPFGFGPDLRDGRPIAPILILGTVVIVAALMISMVTRYRSANHVERQQQRWFVLALAVSAIGLATAAWEGTLSAEPADSFGLTLYVFVGALVPLAIGVAILRYRLYDLDRLISRTVSWSVVTACLVAIFAFLVVGLQAVLDGITQGETVAVALSTIVAAALFQPARRRVQQAVDRRFDRGRYDADRTVAAFAERLRNEVDLSRVAGDVLGVVDIALHPTSRALWLRTNGIAPGPDSSAVTIPGHSFRTVTPT